MKNKRIGADWDDVEKEIFTPEERAQSNLRVEIIGELIKARTEKGISQRELETLSGVSQPVISRIEKGHSMPSIDTILKLLSALGMTLAVIPKN